MGGALLWITTAVQLALAVQGASVHSRAQGVEGEEAARLASALRASLLWPMQPQLDQHQHSQHGVSNKQQGLSSFGGHRARRGAEQPVQDAGEQDQDREEGEAEAGEQPPESGLRRWVIKMRNFMFGRRDLEDTEGGEEHGPPPEGRTWVESLAHWFAHGIKGLLLRMSNSGQAPEGMPQQQDEGADSDEVPEEEGGDGGRSKAGSDRLPSKPTPDRRRPKPTPSATTPMRPWTALPPVARTTPPPSAPPTASTTLPPPPATSAEPEKEPEEPEEPERQEEPEDHPEPESEPEDSVNNANPIPSAAAASGTAVFDDETLARRDHVLEAAKPATPSPAGKPPAEETNELK